MADLIAYQSGDWTGATTWKGVATSTGAKQASIASSTNTTTSYVYSPTFTVTNAVVIEGLLLYCQRLTTTGTVSVALSDDNGVTATREVTVNASDLPAEQSWVFFRFGTTLTGDGGTDYRIGVRGSTTNNANFFRSATTADWARYLRTNSTATIASSDVTFICDELTGTGAKTDVEVTVDDAASTAYGECNIGAGGVLSYGTSASTNYILDLAGNLNVWGDGTLNIGTSGTRIPSTSTAVLEFNCTTGEQYRLLPRSGSTVNMYGAQKRTWAKATATANTGQAIIDVEDTTGWAANDILQFTRTQRNTSISTGTISTVNSSTRITLTSNIGFILEGVYPYQGVVGNSYKNVIVRGISALNHSSITATGLTNFTFNVDNVRFTWLRRLQFTSQTNSTVNFTDCGFDTMQNTSDPAVTPTAGTTFTRCVFYSTTAQAISGTAIIDECAFLRNGNGSYGALVLGTGSELKNSYITNHGNGASTSIAAVQTGDVSVITGNTFISNSAIALQINSAVSRTYSNNTFVRGFIFGVQVNAGVDVVFDNCYFDGHSTANINVVSPITFKNCTFNAGVTNLAPTEIRLAGGNAVFENCDFGQTSAATNFVEAASPVSGRLITATFTNCDIGETLAVVGQSNLVSENGITSLIGIDKLNGTSGAHRAYKQFGFSASDQSVYRTASPSEQLNPNSASGKLPSGSKKFGVASGTTATVSVWVRKSATYNGNEPRLVVKRNIIAGITSDTVLATASGATNTWLELTGTTATVSDDCVLEVYVDCDGTAGTVNVDDWSVT